MIVKNKMHTGKIDTPDTGRALILKDYYIMCTITQIVVLITPKFGQHKHKFFTVI